VVSWIDELIDNAKLSALVMIFLSTELPLYMGWGIAVIVIFVFISILSGKMDVPGALVGGGIACLLFYGGGWPLLAILFAFFVLGVAATQYKKSYKKAFALAQENEGKRSVRHALANGGVGALYALVATQIDVYHLLFVAMSAACFASATADTLSSEMGNVLGRRYINILSLKEDKRGRDGVISLEGTLIGSLGSLWIGVIFFWGYGDFEYGMWVALAGIIGNTTDSILGATLQREDWMNNDQVNFASTLIAALSVWGMYLLS